MGGMPQPLILVASGDLRPAVELDAVCAAHGFGRFTELDFDGLRELVGALDGYERRVSAQRRALFVELDALTDELVRRLAESSRA